METCTSTFGSGQSLDLEDQTIRIGTGRKEKLRSQKNTWSAGSSGHPLVLVCLSTGVLVCWRLVWSTGALVVLFRWSGGHFYFSAS